MKTKLIIILLCSALLLVSCGKKETADTGTSAPETTEYTETTENIPEASDFDFENAVIEGYVFTNPGETVTLPEYADGEQVSSRPSVAAWENGALTAKSAGTCLAGDTATGKAYIVCSLPEETAPNISAGEPTLLEVGKTSFVEGFASADKFTTSDPDVIALEGTVAKAVGPGYAVVDVSNISMPKAFSFIVFDRTAER